MEFLQDYTLVIDDTLNGFNDAFIDDRTRQIMVSPAVFTLLQDSDSRATILAQITSHNLEFFSELIDKFRSNKNTLNTRELGRW